MSGFGLRGILLEKSKYGLLMKCFTSKKRINHHGKQSLCIIYIYNDKTSQVLLRKVVHIIKGCTSLCCIQGHRGPGAYPKRSRARGVVRPGRSANSSQGTLTHMPQAI